MPTRHTKKLKTLAMTAPLDWSDFREREITDETEQTLDCYELGGMPKFYEIQ